MQIGPARQLLVQVAQKRRALAFLQLDDVRDKTGAREKRFAVGLWLDADQGVLRQERAGGMAIMPQPRRMAATGILTRVHCVERAEERL